MRPKDRYDIADLDESQFEPGSRQHVLKNLLGITRKREMDQLEGREQVRSLEELAASYDKDHRFTAADVCRIHQVWLGRIYSWSGRYRQMNVKKDEFPFAAAAQIPKLMTDFEVGPLRQHTPCRPTSIDRLAASLAEVHVELVLIHPFREGNRRAARILAVLMGLQAGLDRDYDPMTKLFTAVIERTLQVHEKT